MKCTHDKVATFASTLFWSVVLGALLVPAFLFLTWWRLDLSAGEKSPGGAWVSIAMAVAPVAFGAVVGLAIACAVWWMRPKRPIGKARLIVTRGALGAGIVLLLLISTMATWVGVRGWATTHAGVESGLAGAMFGALMGLEAFASQGWLYGSIIGAIAALVARHKPSSIDERPAKPVQAPEPAAGPPSDRESSPPAR